jgi:hypothetical protein
MEHHTPMSTPFDPRQHLRELDNGAQYLDVKWRLHWLRSEHPEAQIETDLLAVEGDMAVCKATVRLPDGGSATGHASAPRSTGSAWIEQAETRAIGRALAALGYGAEYADEDLVTARGSERPVALLPAPVSQPERAARPERERPERPERPERTERAERSDRSERSEREEDPAPPVQLQPERGRPARDDAVLREERQRPRELREAAPAPEPVEEAPPPIPAMGRGSDLRARRQAPAEADAAAPEDVSWTKFWEWARRRGYRDAQQLRDLLGIEVGALTPAEVRDHIRRYEMEQKPEE